MAKWSQQLGSNGTHPVLDTPHEVEVSVRECDYVDSILCTRDPSGDDAKGTWSGDSGGPITFKIGDQHVLVGDVSVGSYPRRWNFHCRISAVRGWIDQIQHTWTKPPLPSLKQKRRFHACGKFTDSNGGKEREA